MTDWQSVTKIPPEKTLLLIFAECVGNDTHDGGVYLGGFVGGEWYWINGLKELRVSDYGYEVTWWAGITDPPGKG